MVVDLRCERRYFRGVFLSESTCKWRDISEEKNGIRRIVWNYRVE